MLSRSQKLLVNGIYTERQFICRDCIRRSNSYLYGRRVSVGINADQRTFQSLNRAAEEIIPFRKQLKDEAKRARSEAQKKGSSKKSKKGDSRLEKWELTVGIEVHAELNTARKLFSEALTSSNETPNTHVALFDAAFPGSQPRFQKETLLPALRAAIAFNCEIQHKSSFDRKHYFYQDQPSGYQITQYYEPFAKDGCIVLYDHDGIAPEDGKLVTIGIKQIQMEQDTAKTLQKPPTTHLLDFNRVSHPLIEIITLPQIHHPSTAAACVRKIQAILKSVNAVTAGMEVGGLRADVNVSVRERNTEPSDAARHSYSGVTGLGQRTEIKNLSSFKAVEDAIIAERDRQIAVLETGGVIEGETRGWSLGSTETRRLRGKEGEIDYRYMPDPDIPPIFIHQNLVDRLRETMPKLPDDVISMLVESSRFGLTTKDAKTLIALDNWERLDYYLELVDILYKTPELVDRKDIIPKVGRTAGNWVLHEIGGLLSTYEQEWSERTVPATELAVIITNLLLRNITGRTAKQLLVMVFNGDTRSVEQIIAQDNLRLVPLSESEYLALARDIINEHSEIADAIKSKGQRGKIMWFVGRMVQQGEEGRVEAQKAEMVLKQLLGVE